MNRMRVAFVALLAMGGWAIAAPPGPLDGSSIPSNFAGSTELAAQTNTTQFGDQIINAGDFTAGSELDGLFLAKVFSDDEDDSNDFLYVGLTGNLERNGHALVIFIDIDNPFFDGQQELRAEGVGGPPFTVQTASREVVINTNGTSDPSDDTWSYGADGTLLPCEADFALAVDTFGGTMSISEYLLFNPTGGAVGTTDPTSDNPNDLPDQDLFATRQFIGQSPINDNNDVLENQNDPDYVHAGFNDTNTSGVTGDDASMADATTSGFEVGIPLNTFQGVNSLNIWVALVDGAGGPGFVGIVTNQVLPPTNSNGVCNPPGVFALRSDLTDDIACRAVTVSTLPTFTGVAEGIIHPAEYGVAAPVELQDCPTPYGDQQFDPDALLPTGGSELNVLWADNDDEFLYLGLTGNVQPGGNTMHIFIDSDPDGADDGQYGPLKTTNWVPFQALKGMDGDTLPTDANSNAVFYNVAYGINLDGGNNNVYVDFWDLANSNGVYRGNSQRNSGDGTLAGGTNPNGMLVALNNLNGAGVVGAQTGDPDFLLSANDVESQARSATLGFEIAVPFADLGVDCSTFPHRVQVWTYITGSGGYGSNQGLPTLRNQSVGGGQVENAGDGPNDYTNPFNPTVNRAYEGRAAEYTMSLALGNGDFNASATVDLADFATFQDCLGADVCLRVECAEGDMDGDTDVDLDDYIEFEAALTGP